MIGRHLSYDDFVRRWADTIRARYWSSEGWDGLEEHPAFLKEVDRVWEVICGREDLETLLGENDVIRYEGQFWALVDVAVPGLLAPEEIEITLRVSRDCIVLLDPESSGDFCLY